MPEREEDAPGTEAGSTTEEPAPSGAPVTQGDSSAGARPVLEMRGISKRFGEIQALDDVSLALIPGEIHALLGENGAGKSTLIKVMTGVVQPDIGDIFIDDQKVHIGSAFDAQTYAVAAIYQEPMVFPDLTVAENIFVGHRDRGRIVNRRQMRSEAEEVLERLDVRLDVMAPASALTLAQQQTVEIAKALSLNVRILIMDEPTASLSAHGAAQLFGIIAKLRSEGVAILFISHRLEEVFEQADRITVMRDGAWISTTQRSEITINEAIRQMVGREVVEFYTRTESHPGEVGVLSASPDASNQNAWIAAYEEALASDAKYDGIVNVETVFGNDKSEDSYNAAIALADKYPDLEVIMSPTTVGIVAAAKAMQDEGLCEDIAVSGLGLPSEMVDFTLNGCGPAFALWSFVDLGYLTTYVSYLIATGALEGVEGVEGETFEVGRPINGETVFEITDDPTSDVEGKLRVLMGPFTIYTPENIEAAAG